MDVFGEVLKEYHQNKKTDPLLLHNNYGLPENMPVEVFFREEDDMPDIELCALDICEGSVLDIGAGVGMHTLVLQNRGINVSALELSKDAIHIMSKRGVKKIYEGDIFLFEKKKFDTLLLLMNGIGLVGTLDKLRVFLDHAKKILKPGGQILMDSSNIMYLYEDIPMPEKKYFGEISYRYEYKGNKGEWFDWLYVDQDTLEEVASEADYHCQVVYEDEDDHYLARLTLK